LHIHPGFNDFDLNSWGFFLTPICKVFQTVLLLILNENNGKWNHELQQICF